jgi:amino acid adenylation domain-containing protein
MSSQVSDSIQQFLSELREAGIGIWVEGEQLRYKAPKDAITPERIAQLRQYKAEILTILQKSQADSTPSNRPPIVVVPREEVLPLSFAQQGLWFLNQLEGPSSTYNIPFALRLEGSLSVPALEQSIQDIVQRHESLRTHFSVVDGTPIQIITPDVTVKLPVVDLQSFDKSQQNAELERLVSENNNHLFDLSKGPLLTTLLVQLSADSHIFLITMHHTISDGWSMGVFTQELSSLYRAHITGESACLPKLPIQYADFSQWQRRWLQEEVLDTQLSYWKRQLADTPPLLELPTDRPRPAVQSFQGRSSHFYVDSNITQQLRALSQRSGATLFMTLMTAFTILLSRYSNQRDIVIGSPIANRTVAEIETLIGFFVNTLVLRTDLSDNPSFLELLKQVRQTALDAYEHQDVPFEKLVEELNPTRDPSYHPLFQVMFVLQNAVSERVNLPELQVTYLKLEQVTSKFDLTLVVEEEDQQLSCTWEYNSDLFDPTSIERFTQHFCTLLSGIIANPKHPIATVPLMTETERHQLLIEWNNTQTNYPSHLCIHQLFEQQAAQTPHAIAVTFKEAQLTYQELNEQANQLAHLLVELGVETETFVAICVERSLEMIIGLLAILKAGGTYIPLDPAYPAERLAFMLEDTQAPVLLTQKQFAEQFASSTAHIVYLDAQSDTLKQQSQLNLQSTLSPTPDHLAYVMYTSGSTGKPKGVSVCHRGVVRLVQNTDYITIKSDDVFLQLAPSAFDASTLEIWGALLNGAQLVLFPHAQPTLAEIGQEITRHQITILWLTAGLFHLMVDERIEDLRSIRQLLAGGDVLSVPHVQKVVEQLEGCTLINGYGPTENTTFTCCHAMTHLAQLGPSIPIGRPIANTQVYVLDEHKQPVPIGVPGELYTGGDGLARGYLNRPDLTAEKFVEHPFNPTQRLYRTGDWVRYQPNGTLEFLGRIDQQVKIRGFRIELDEIESVLSQYSAVQQCIVIVREDEPGDKRLVAYIVMDGQPSASTVQLRQFLQQTLPNHMIPSAFMQLETLPLTPNGKVDRRALPKPEISTAQVETVYVAPSTPQEQDMADIWAKALNVERVGIYDNFFDLGGHSLLAVRVFAEIEKKWDAKFPLSVLFKNPSIHALIQILQNKETVTEKSSLVALQPKGSKPPIFGLHAIGTSVQFYRNLSNYLGSDQPFYGIQSQFLAQSNPNLTLEDMAAFYIKDIQTIQPEGPYLLAGYSYGGSVVYEIAQQLEKMGQKVSLLAIIDFAAPGAYKRLTVQQQLFQHWKNSLTHGTTYVKEKVSRQLKFRLDRLRALFKRRMKDKKPEINSRAYFESRLRQIEALHLKTLTDYQFKEYSGKITFFRSDTPPDNVGDVWEPDRGWTKFAKGGLEIYDVPGKHFNIFAEPYVQVLAKQFKHCLDETLVGK